MKKLVSKILAASNTIAQASRSGSGKFMVVSKEVADMLTKSEAEILREKRKEKLEVLQNKLN